MLERKLGPVVRQSIVAKEAPPHELIIPRGLAGRAKRQVHPEHVLGVDALGLDRHVALAQLLVLLAAGGTTGLPGVHVAPRAEGQPPPALVGALHGHRRRQVRVGVVVPVQAQQVPGQVVHDVGGLQRRQQADGGAVAEEAQVPVVRDDVNRRAAPGGLVGGRLPRAHVVDGADVAPVEADPGPPAEHGPPGGVGDGHEGRRGGCVLGRRAGEPVVLVEGFPFHRLVPAAVHRCEAEPRAEADVAPCALLGGDQVREGFADEREARKVAYVEGRHVLHDVDEELAGEAGEGARRGWCAVCFGGRCFDLEAGKAGDEVFDGE